jgi:hypothetical protein
LRQLDARQGLAAMSTRARCGIILHPAGHTLSPVLHRTAYAALGLTPEFGLRRLRPRLRAAGRGAARCGTDQLCVSPARTKKRPLYWRPRVGRSRDGWVRGNTRPPRQRARRRQHRLDRSVTRRARSHGPWHGKPRHGVGRGWAARAVVFALRQLGCR